MTLKWTVKVQDQERLVLHTRSWSWFCKTYKTRPSISLTSNNGTLMQFYLHVLTLVISLPCYKRFMANQLSDDYFYYTYVEVSGMCFIQMAMPINTCTRVLRVFYTSICCFHARAFLNEHARRNPKSANKKNFDPFGSCISRYKTRLLIYKLYLYAIKTWNSRIKQDKLAICIYMQYCFQTYPVKHFRKNSLWVQPLLIKMRRYEQSWLFHFSSSIKWGIFFFFVIFSLAVRNTYKLFQFPSFMAGVPRCRLRFGYRLSCFLF